MKTLMPLLLIGLSLTPTVKAATIEELIDLELAPGLDAHRCEIQVQHNEKVLTIKNLMSQPGSLRTLSNLRPKTSGDTITFEFPNQFTATIGTVSQCLSLIAKEDFVFMSEKSANERMLKNRDGRYIDVCWQHGTGVRDPRREKSDGHIYVYLAERRLKDDVPGRKRLSLDLADVRRENVVFVSGANAASGTVPGLGEVKVSCDYHVLSEEERESVKRRLLGQPDNNDRSPSSRTGGVQTENRSLKVAPGKQVQTESNEGADLAK